MKTTTQRLDFSRLERAVFRSVYGEILALF